MKITFTRENEQIYTAKSDTAYWSDGQPVNERLAFNRAGFLSNSEAQAIDRKNGSRYILVSAFGVKSAPLLESIRALAIGESCAFTR